MPALVVAASARAAEGFLRPSRASHDIPFRRRERWRARIAATFDTPPNEDRAELPAGAHAARFFSTNKRAEAMRALWSAIDCRGLPRFSIYGGERTPRAFITPVWAALDGRRGIQANVAPWTVHGRWVVVSAEASKPPVCVVQAVSCIYKESGHGRTKSRISKHRRKRSS